MTFKSCALLASLLLSPIALAAGDLKTQGQRTTPLVVEPLLIDLDADGFQLSSVEDGVQFDLDADGRPEQTAWTAKGADDAFVAMDVISTGKIENGRKLLGGLFGREVGFTTLQRLEEQTNPSGGRADGMISEGDGIYSTLILWVDSNHNGTAEGQELKSLTSAGVVRMFVGVVGIDERDDHGNVWRYRAQALVKNQAGVPVATEVRSIRLAHR